MCGIAGWYARGGRPVETGVVRAMCATIVHRGPDDDGVLAEGDFGFGMRRLSIVDLSGGHQPMESADGRYVITFNGEIFNHPALRAELESLGHVYRTHSDTESILLGFVQWGDGVWARLEGMFAAAIWDRRERTLHLARDPLGIKPLFHTLQGGGLAWGSELKTLTAVPGLSFTPRAKSMDEYFAFGHVLAPHTIYDEVVKLPPGCFMTLGPSGEPRTERFWSFAYRRPPEAGEREWIERFRETFLGCVRRHLQADVPLGAFLSGGVDSTAVVAAMSHVMNEPVRTFTIGFSAAEFDESPWARRAAEHLKCVHTERRVELAEAASLLPALARAYDEPFADPSAIPTWYVSQLAREQVTVAMSGDGGDELFAGYERHHNERLVQEHGSLFALARGLAKLPPLPLPRWNYLRQRLAKVGADAALPGTFQRFFSKYQLAPRAVRAALYRPEFTAQLDPGDELDRLAAEYFPKPVSARPGGEPALRGHRRATARRHAHQGGPREHGALAGGARAVPGAHVRGLRRVRARGPEAARRDRQVPRAQGRRAVAAAGLPGPPQAGIRRAARALGARRPGDVRRERLARRARRRIGRAAPRGRGRALRRAPLGPRRPLADALRARHVRAVVGGAPARVRRAARRVRTNRSRPGPLRDLRGAFPDGTRPYARGPGSAISASPSHVNFTLPRWTSFMAYSASLPT